MVTLTAFDVKKVEYQLFQIINLNDEQQMALCLGTDTDIDTAGNAYTTSFGGKCGCVERPVHPCLGD